MFFKKVRGTLENLFGLNKTIKQVCTCLYNTLKRTTIRQNKLSGGSGVSIKQLNV